MRRLVGSLHAFSTAPGGRVRIGLCTDSSAQLPPDLRSRFDVEIVPQTIVVDDVELLDGIDLDADAFYDRFTGEHWPVVDSSQPSPGQFAVAYDDLAAKGCTEILSIHITGSMSNTINAARLAAHGASVPVRIVDSGTASFGTSCCVWAAAEAIAAGACLDHAARIAESVAPTIGSVFVFGALDLVAASGRVDLGDLEADDGIPVFTMRDAKIEVLERVSSMDSAVRVMAAYLTSWGDELRVAIGLADRHAEALTLALREHVAASSKVAETISYRIGPAIGAHTGPGTVGAFAFPGSFPVSVPR